MKLNRLLQAPLMPNILGCLIFQKSLRSEGHSNVSILTGYNLMVHDIFNEIQEDLSHLVCVCVIHT